ncbi:uncharacterized protein I303_100076 [Kwoniella dejecticola CBS 10117]|uniref:Uncharacterized protein n=1 Tax=Kwoniella dejecticola CBS 10117 TaxID=1296121 RepID=A0A1A6ADX6_9TREE|nr:uncharacterized protein I303_00076 [Kwoniella dejecticola CBS 10117]OBR88265.1 hypothetical protein I303_00076 [Kwoniella dejecticola CBS 10117]
MRRDQSSHSCATALAQPPSFDIVSLDKLRPVQDLIFHYLRTDHPQSVLQLNKKLYQETIPIVYHSVAVQGDGLHKLVRNLVQLKEDPAKKGRLPVYSEIVIKASKHIESLSISDLVNGEEVDKVLRLWMLYKMDLIFPKLQHINLGEGFIEKALDASRDPASYTGSLGLDVLVHIIASCSMKTLCLDWPMTEVILNEYGEQDGSVLDSFIPELVRNLDQTTVELETIKVHITDNNLGKMISKIVAYKTPWAEYRPKVIIDMTNESNQQTRDVLGKVWGAVLSAMDELLENDLHFEGPMIGDDITFILPDSMDKEEAIKMIAEEEVLDDYESMWDTVLDNIVWKNKDNSEDWICPCGRYPAKDVCEGAVVQDEDGDEVEKEDPSQTKIDAYFKPMLER